VALRAVAAPGQHTCILAHASIAYIKMVLVHSCKGTVPDGLKASTAHVPPRTRSTAPDYPRPALHTSALNTRHAHDGIDTAARIRVHGYGCTDTGARIRMNRYVARARMRVTGASVRVHGHPPACGGCLDLCSATTLAPHNYART
jgi:hypothetical protein